VSFAACAGETYRVRIGGYTTNGYTATGSGPVSLNLVELDAPLVPQNLQIQILGGSVFLSWNPVDSNELGCPLSGVMYNILAFDANGNGWVLGTTGDTSAFLPGEFQDDTTRTYRVVAGNPSAAAAEYAPVSFQGNTVMTDNGLLTK